MAKVTIQDSGPVAGVFVECDKGMVALCAADGQGAYLEIWPYKDGKPDGALPFGIALNPDGSPFVQLPAPKASGQQVIRLDTLYDLVEALRKGSLAVHQATTPVPPPA